jgi:two-component system chemotaxis sensor kinase CheA
VVPLTLAVIKALFVTVGSMFYAVPLVNIERLVTVNKKDIKGMMNFEAIVLDGKDIPITRLSSLFELLPAASDDKQAIIIVNREGERFGVAVDAFLVSQEIVVKPLSKLIKENQYFAGSTIIGSGEVVLILDVTNLALSCRRNMQING